MDEHSFLDLPDEIKKAKSLFPAAPGEAADAAYHEMRALVHAALDEWLRTIPPMPIEQVDFPPEPWLDNFRRRYTWRRKPDAVINHC
ncbi:hypothetical protein [Caballeronia sordidicola]|uniref:hypothetical protein n=1 Tax=Caballeronia sordidicola TaxID=196367 RepID=UPI0004CFEC29|nr:hypothetical protein [Caballeronia sordidicola]